MVTLKDLMPQASRMELMHPVMGALGIYIEVVGQDSLQYRQVTKQLMKARLDRDGKKMDVEQMEKDNAALIASCIVGWSDDGVFDAYTPERAKELMVMPELSWIREQLEAFVSERANFFRKD